MWVSGNTRTMTGPADTDQSRRERALELLSALEDPVIQVSKSIYRVGSSSGGLYHTVRRRHGAWTCDCPAGGGMVTCTHIWMVRLWLRPGEARILEKAVPSPERSYSQDWPAYDSAQQDEHVLFDPLLWSLLETVPEPPKAVGARGRPPIPLRTQLLIAVKKVHFGESARRIRGLLQVVYGSGDGLLSKVPNYAVPSRFLNRPDSGDILLNLIRESARPLRDLEDGGTVAIDSTGFCTTCMGAYCTEKHDPNRKHRWVKAHVIVGVKTHVILDVKITDENGADCPQFVPLLKSVLDSGFSPASVVGDKAYLSFENYSTADDLGITATIPFKVNSISGEVRRARGLKTPPAWDRAYHRFMLQREEFARDYHLRSNVEAVFSAVKRKLGESLLSKNPLARFNETLARLLAYNIGVIVHEIHEHGIDPASIGLQRPGPSPTAAAEAPRPAPVVEALELVDGCDSTVDPVTEIEESSD